MHRFELTMRQVRTDGYLAIHACQDCLAVQIVVNIEHETSYDDATQTTVVEPPLNSCLAKTQ